MADSTDLQRLLVSLEASFTKYERSWQRAQGLTDTNVKAVGQKFDRVSAKISTFGSSTGDAFKPVRVQTANIAAQFQDIAVQLQGGQSPFTIALQQGTQLTAALGTGGGLRGALTGLSAGLASLVNPVSLATIAIITLGGTAVQWLLEMGKQADDTSDHLEKHVARIKEIVAGYDGAARAVDDYIEKQKRLPEIAARAELTDQQDKALKTLAERFKDILALRSDFEGFAGYADAFGVPQEIGDQLERVRDLLRDVTADGKLTAGEVADLTNAFTLLKTSTDDQNIRKISADALAALASFKDAATAVESFGIAIDNLPEKVAISVELQTNAGSFADAIKQLKDLAPELRSAGDVARAAAKDALNTALGSAGSGVERSAALKDYQTTLAAIGEEERRLDEARTERSGRSGAKAIENEKQAVLDLISALQFEGQTLGLSAEDQAVMNGLRQAGAAATAEQKAQIEELIRANFEQAKSLDETKVAMEQVQSLAQSAFSSFVNDIRQGKSAADALNNTLGNLANKLLDMALNNAIAGLFGGLLGGGIGGLKGLPGMGGLKGSVSYRAGGGPVQAGRSYIVGEKRPELFVPSSNGMILPRLPGADGARKVVNNVYNYGNDRVEQRQNSTGGVDTIIGAVEQRIKSNMARGQYRQFGVDPGTVRR